MTTKRTFLKTALAAAILASGASSMAMAQQKTLKFATWQREEAGFKDWWIAVVEDFEKANPGAKIEWVNIPRTSYADSMTTSFAGGKTPDIIHAAAFEYQRWADNGWMAPLDPFIARDKVDLKGWAGQDVCVWKGKTYCTMQLFVGYFLAYNEALLKKEGLAVPKNYEEFLAAARKLTKDTNGDGVPDQFGTGHETKAVSGGQYLSGLMNYTLDVPGAAWTDANGKVTANTPAMAEGLGRFKTVVREGLTPRDLGISDIRTLFQNGKIAMMADGPWMWPIMQRALVKDDLKIAPSPFKVPMGGTSVAIGIGEDIPKENKELAWKFIQVANSPKFMAKWAIDTGNIPPDPKADLTEYKAKTPHADIAIAATRKAAENKVDRIPKGLELQFNEFAKMVMEETQRMIIENLDPKVAAAAIEKRAIALQKQ